MPISTVYILKYVNNAKFKWFSTIFSLGAPEFLSVISLINLCSQVYFLTTGNALGLLRCLSKVRHLI